MTKDNNCLLIFDVDKFYVQDKNSQQIIHQGSFHKGIYHLPLISTHKSLHSGSPSHALHCFKATSQIWHKRLGHPSHGKFQSLVHEFHLPVSTIENIVCQHCATAKSHGLSFPISHSSACNPLHIVHSDVWGSASINSINGFRYYAIFVDDYTRFTWIFPVRCKSELFTHFLTFKRLVENQFSKTIKVLRSDCGGEYLSINMKTFLSHHGIIHQTTCPYTPQQNGIAERKHRHLVETSLTLLHQSNLPTSY